MSVFVLYFCNVAVMVSCIVAVQEANLFSLLYRKKVIWIGRAKQKTRGLLFGALPLLTTEMMEITSRRSVLIEGVFVELLLI